MQFTTQYAVVFLSSYCTLLSELPKNRVSRKNNKYLCMLAVYCKLPHLFQMAMIIRNLSFEEENVEILAKNIVVFR